MLVPTICLTIPNELLCDDGHLRKLPQGSCETSQCRTRGALFTAHHRRECALLTMAVPFLYALSIEVPIMEGVLLQTVEGLGESPLPGELWELLQAEKESIASEILADGSTPS